MKSVLLARVSERGDVFTRIIYPDYVLHDVDEGLYVSLYHPVLWMDTMIVTAADMTNVLVGTRLQRRRTPFVLIDARKRIWCRDATYHHKCRSVGPKWTVITGDDVDELIWRMRAVVDSELFFTGSIEKSSQLPYSDTALRHRAQTPRSDTALRHHTQTSPVKFTGA